MIRKSAEHDLAVENIERDTEALSALTECVCLAIENESPISSTGIDCLMRLVINDINQNVAKL